MRLAVVALALMTSPAMAQLVLPPEEFDRPYQGQTVIRWKDTIDEVRAICKTPTVLGLGCAHLRDGACIITMARESVLRSAGFDEKILIRHETAHCNGWPRHHPNARMWTR